MRHGEVFKVKGREESQSSLYSGTHPVFDLKQEFNKCELRYCFWTMSKVVLSPMASFNCFLKAASDVVFHLISNGKTLAGVNVTT